MPSWRGKWPTPQISIDGAVPTDGPYRPHSCTFALASGWIADHAWLHVLVADRPRPSLFHTREQENGLLELIRSLVRTRWSGCSTRWSGCATHGASRLPRFGPPSSGNRAFDEYRMETLRRLEEEQTEFKDFLDRLRHAKDKEEFDAVHGAAPPASDAAERSAAGSNWHADALA